MAWLHADVVMLFVGLVLAVLVAVWLTSDSTRAKATWRGVLVVTLLQGAIGYAQYFTGLPEVLVALHMLGASPARGGRHARRDEPPSPPDLTDLTDLTDRLCGAGTSSVRSRARPGRVDRSEGRPGEGRSAQDGEVQQGVERDRDEEHRQVGDREVEQPHRAQDVGAAPARAARSRRCASPRKSAPDRTAPAR